MQDLGSRKREIPGKKKVMEVSNLTTHKSPWGSCFNAYFDCVRLGVGGPRVCICANSQVRICCRSHWKAGSKVEKESQTYLEALGHNWASLVSQSIKNLPAVQRTWVRSLGWEDALEKGRATHSNILAWRIPWTV